MNKACAVYRDGSKLSQPLMNSLVDMSSIEEEEEEIVTAQKAVKQVAEALPLPEERPTSGGSIRSQLHRISPNFARSS